MLLINITKQQNHTNFCLPLITSSNNNDANNNNEIVHCFKVKEGKKEESKQN